MSRRGMLVITLITTLMLVCLIATYAWFLSSTNTIGVIQISSGVQEEIVISSTDFVSKGDSTNGSVSSTGDVYSGQKAYYLDSGTYKAYEDEDKPYYVYQNIAYTAKCSQNLSIMFNLKKVEITLSRKNITVETMLANYLDITGVSDYTNYLEVYDSENKTYTAPVVDAGVYFVTTDTNTQPTKDSMVSKIVLTALAKNYFEYKFWASNSSGATEPTTADSYNKEIVLVYGSQVTESGKTNYVRFKLGYYGLNTETNNYEMPFAFSDYAFMGSSYKFFIEAIGV